MEVDHIFICTKPKAPEADILIEFGLCEGKSNTHPGQGTANRRFFFQNAMLELLWVEDVDEVQSELTSPMKLYERCFGADDTISPFGIAFRPSTTDEKILFNTWDYHPMYLPESLKIQVAHGVPITEPLFFYLSFAKRNELENKQSSEPCEHHIPLRNLTKVSISNNSASELSEVAKVLNNLDDFHIGLSTKNLLELEFDNALGENSKDFRPELPLIIKW